MSRHQDFVIFKNWTEKWIALLKYYMVNDFDFSITVGLKCTNSGHLWCNLALMTS